MSYGRVKKMRREALGKIKGGKEKKRRQGRGRKEMKRWKLEMGGGRTRKRRGKGDMSPNLKTD